MLKWAQRALGDIHNKREAVSLIKLNCPRTKVTELTVCDNSTNAARNKSNSTIAAVSNMLPFCIQASAAVLSIPSRACAREGRKGVRSTSCTTCAASSKILMWSVLRNSKGIAKLQTKGVPSVPKKTHPSPSGQASCAPKKVGLAGTISS